MPYASQFALPETLRATLDALQPVFADACDPWRLIGSAAMALHGADVSPVQDVDLLMSERDASAGLQALGAEILKEAGAPQFRSRIFGRWTGAPLVVELMGGFEVTTPHGWRTIEPQPADIIEIGAYSVRVATHADLLEMCRLFGRPKDQKRAEALRKIAG